MTKLAEGQRIRLPGEDRYVVVELAQATSDGGLKLVVEDRGDLRKAASPPLKRRHIDALTEDGAAEPADGARRAVGRVDARAPRRRPRQPRSPRRRCGRTRTRTEPSTGRCSRSRCCGSCSPMSPAPARRSWPGCTCARCSASASSDGRSDRVPSAPRDEVAGRLRALPRRRPAPDHRRHDPRGRASARHDLWVVSLELAAVNPAVHEAIHPDRAGWDAVVFDEAHRLTPDSAASTTA